MFTFGMFFMLKTEMTSFCIGLQYENNYMIENKMFNMRKIFQI